MLSLRGSSLLVASLLAMVTASSGLQCNGRGYEIYQGPANRSICLCDLGWKGLQCKYPFTKKDYGPEYPCTKPGFRDTCEAGMQCVAEYYTNSSYCACDYESTNPHCQLTLSERAEKSGSCRYAGCPRGLKCGSYGCECLPFSRHPMCQCTGNFTDVFTGAQVACKRGADGFCAPVNASDPSLMCYYTPIMAAAPGFDTCPPGTALNNAAQCVCLPLSINPSCRGNPPPAQNISNVCAMYPPFCKQPYSVNYTIYKSGALVANGTSTLRPLRNYVLVTKGIVADEEYEFCSAPVNRTNWEIVDPGFMCTRMDGDMCCQQVSSNLGSTNFTSGCAGWQQLVNTTAC